MKGIAYGFETVIISIITFMCIGIAAEKKPKMVDKIFRTLFFIKDDD